MTRGRKFSGKRKIRTGIEDDYLYINIVEDTNSAWFGRIFVPRMVTNLLNHSLELGMKELDIKILKNRFKVYLKINNVLYG